jgi:hypothetical protein
MTTTTLTRVALKEWQVVWDAVLAGEQTLLLRKGGIAEPDSRFTPRGGPFLLYPTTIHQKPALVREPWNRQVRTDPLEELPIRGLARIAAAFELAPAHADRLDRLEAFHIWTRDYAAERLHWKADRPLAVLVLEARRLGQPLLVRRDPELEGCFSWLDLPVEASWDEARPVQDAKSLAEVSAAVSEALG